MPCSRRGSNHVVQHLRHQAPHLRLRAGRQRGEREAGLLHWFAVPEMGDGDGGERIFGFCEHWKWVRRDIFWLTESAPAKLYF